MHTIHIDIKGVGGTFKDVHGRCFYMILYVGRRRLSESYAKGIVIYSLVLGKLLGKPGYCNVVKQFVNIVRVSFRVINCARKAVPI